MRGRVYLLPSGATVFLPAAPNLQQRRTLRAKGYRGHDPRRWRGEARLVRDVPGYAGHVRKAQQGLQRLVQAQARGRRS